MRQVVPAKALFGAVACTLILSGAAHAASAPTSQFVRWASWFERQATLLLFTARNGPEWNAEVQRVGVEPHTDARDAGLRGAWRTPARPEAAVPVSASEAIASARAFVRKNHDLLGLDLAVFEAARVSTIAGTASDRSAWIIHFGATLPAQPGYEAFDLRPTVDLHVTIARSGQVEGFIDNSVRVPMLTLATKPLHRASDDVILRGIVGQPMRIDQFRYGGPEVHKDLGTIARVDIARATLTLWRTNIPAEGGERITLAYRIDVARQGYHQSFVVDASDGTVMATAPLS